MIGSRQQNPAADHSPDNWLDAAIVNRRHALPPSTMGQYPIPDDYGFDWDGATHRGDHLALCNARVVNDQEVSPFAGDGTPNPGRLHAPRATGDIPVRDAGRRTGHVHTENPRSPFVQDVAGLASPTAGELSFVTGKNNAVIRKRTQIPGRQVFRT